MEAGLIHAEKRMDYTPFNFPKSVKISACIPSIYKIISVHMVLKSENPSYLWFTNGEE